MQNNIKVYIDPAVEINYASFYFIGLRELFGKDNIVFTNKYFNNLHYSKDTHVVAFVIEGLKYVIDFADSNKVFYEDFLDWSDFYGKVNYNEEFIHDKNKVRRVGPNFAMKCYNFIFQYICTAITCYFKCYKRIDFSFQTFFRRYLSLSKRASFNNTAIINNEQNLDSKRIYFFSTFWEGQDSVNNRRINFIRACQRLDSEGIISFYGGLISSNQQNKCPKDVLFKKRIPYKEYLESINKSMIVFNTPAYFDCHGWKLPEYISLGKIIVSTPFINELPIPLVHKRNIYFVNDDEDSIYFGIKELIRNQEMLSSLAKGSKHYWDTVASPRSCISLFLKTCDNAMIR